MSLYLLKCAVYAAWSSNLIGGPQATTDRFNWFRNVHPGMLVMETSTAWVNDRDEHRFGHLIAIERGNFHTDEEWEEVKDGYSEEDGRPQDTFWRIKLLSDGTEYRWRNCSFIRVPENLKDFP
jgi:hypothetical protein